MKTAPLAHIGGVPLKTARRRKRQSNGLDHRVIRSSSSSVVKPIKMTSVGSGRHEGEEDKTVEVEDEGEEDEGEEDKTVEVEVVLLKIGEQIVGLLQPLP